MSHRGRVARVRFDKWNEYCLVYDRGRKLPRVVPIEISGTKIATTSLVLEAAITLARRQLEVVDPVDCVVVDRAAVLSARLLAPNIELADSGQLYNQCTQEVSAYRGSDHVCGVAINVVHAFELGKNIEKAGYNLEKPLGSSQAVLFATECD